MKKTIILASLIGLAFTTHAQRHLKGSSGIEIGGGVSAIGLYAEPAYFRNLSGRSTIKFSLQTEIGELSEFKFRSHILNASFGYTLAKIANNTFYLNALGGISSNYDQVKISSEAKDTFVNFGVFAGLEIDIYASDRFIIAPSFRQRYNFKKVPGNQVWYSGLGIKYVF